MGHRQELYDLHSPLTKQRQLADSKVHRAEGIKSSQSDKGLGNTQPAAQEKLLHVQIKTQQFTINQRLDN